MKSISDTYKAHQSKQQQQTGPPDSNANQNHAMDDTLSSPSSQQQHQQYASYYHGSTSQWKRLQSFLHNLELTGQLLELRGDYATALCYFKSALDIANVTQPHASSALTLNILTNIAQLHLKSQMWSDYQEDMTILQQNLTQRMDLPVTSTSNAESTTGKKKTARGSKTNNKEEQEVTSSTAILEEQSWSQLCQIIRVKLVQGEFHQRNYNNFKQGVTTNQQPSRGLAEEFLVAKKMYDDALKMIDGLLAAPEKQNPFHWQPR
jgi:hypothetical protein